MTNLSPVLILGANSDVARACAHEYASAGCSLILAARQSQRLEADSADLKIRYGAKVDIRDFDILATDAYETFLDALPELPATVICAVGLLTDQKKLNGDRDATDLMMRTNFLGPALILSALANRMEARGSGCLIGISSVAGERGRQSNYIYGASKSGLTAFLSGLRNRLYPKGVAVITVIPGFIRTAMTAGMQLPPVVTAEAAEVAKAIRRAQETKRDVVFVRPIWWLIMAVIRNIPEAIFKRLSL